jgi:hypothetical protein
MDKIATDAQTDSAIFRKNILAFQMQSAVLGKVVVRELNSGLYLNETGFLTREIENGKRFDTATVALQEAKRVRLQAAEVVSISKS